jgi:hypothetical protein
VSDPFCRHGPNWTFVAGHSIEMCLHCILLQRDIGSWLVMSGTAAWFSSSLRAFPSDHLGWVERMHMAHGLWCCFSSCFCSLRLMIRDCNS